MAARRSHALWGRPHACARASRLLARRGDDTMRARARAATHARTHTRTQSCDRASRCSDLSGALFAQRRVLIGSASDGARAQNSRSACAIGLAATSAASEHTKYHKANASSRTLAAIDQDYGLSVADQFVVEDNDALFRCQVAPAMRDLVQVTGWLEDGQTLHTPAARHTNATAQQRVLMLPDGQLYFMRAKLSDAGKSFRCQTRNSLTQRTALSPLSGRLFVTGEYSARAL